MDKKTSTQTGLTVTQDALDYIIHARDNYRCESGKIDAIPILMWGETMSKDSQSFGIRPYIGFYDSVANIADLEEVGGMHFVNGFDDYNDDTIDNIWHISLGSDGLVAKQEDRL